jgi:hypothetical protein
VLFLHKKTTLVVIDFDRQSFFKKNTLPQLTMAVTTGHFLAEPCLTFSKIEKVHL